ncbi:MAG: hypothetical protein K2L48_04850 [Mycoplasmoidaceae bacterium]|nr:hypothetical protein [Mycoplasmoidaceae bacterium]
MKMNKRYIYIYILSIASITSFGYTTTNHLSFSSNNSLFESKTSLLEIFSNPSIPKYSNLFHTPTNADVYSFLHTYLVENNKTEYLSVLNDIVINSIQNGRITISTSIYSTSYEGQLVFDYSLQSKQDLATVITNTTLFSTESESV